MSKLPQIGGQVIEELDQLIELVNPIQPTSYLEIGAREGHALRYFVERVPSIERVTVVDMPGARWGKFGSEMHLYNNLRALDVEYDVYLGNSTDPEIVGRVTAQRYSIIFIDGDHTYEGVVADINNYGPVADDYICLHDINHPPDSPAYGPSKLWGEIAAMGDVEFIAVGSKKGIGVKYL